MTTKDTTKLVSALTDGSDADVKEELSALLNSSTTSGEEGEALFAVGGVYARQTNAANREYLAKLEAIEEAVDALASSGKRMGEAVQVAKTRESLA